MKKLTWIVSVLALTVILTPIFCLADDIDDALLGAALHSNFQKVKELVSKGANVDAQGSMGYTALMSAASGAHLEIIKLLIDQGADVNAKENNGRTALWYAELKGRSDIVKLLKKSGVK